MPKIIKNGKEYSGVPIEVVTAWAPTADPVQVKEPLMGNTDISTIGDGTVTGAIDTLNSGLINLMGIKIEWGVNSGSGLRTVTFSSEFTEIPRVVATPTNASTPTDWVRSCTVTEVTTTGFKFYELATNGNTPVQGTDGCYWIAVGR